MLHEPLGSRDSQRARAAPVVYVIDDEPHLRESSCFLLRSLDLACIQFPDGRAFLDALHGLQPGCILLDARMRSVGGLEVQDELGRRGVDWPIVFMSGYHDIPTVAEAMKNGAVEFLEKPFAEEELLAALHRGFVKLRKKGLN
ncbi:MAG TPA: response regulator [Allosphingosinicella sp.]|uniref:response regulator transcription factor n=1 Tax=Allosphingosinicella sp. TaxID=2823234 RepID=UPI002EDA513E